MQTMLGNKHDNNKHIKQTNKYMYDLLHIHVLWEQMYSNYVKNQF